MTQNRGCISRLYTKGPSLWNGLLWCDGWEMLGFGTQLLFNSTKTDHSLLSAYVQEVQLQNQPVLSWLLCNHRYTYLDDALSVVLYLRRYVCASAMLERSRSACEQIHLYWETMSLRIKSATTSLLLNRFSPNLFCYNPQTQINPGCTGCSR